MGVGLQGTRHQRQEGLGTRTASGGGGGGAAAGSGKKHAAAKEVDASRVFDPGGAWLAAEGGVPDGGGAGARLASGANVKQHREALQQQLHALAHLSQ